MDWYVSCPLGRSYCHGMQGEGDHGLEGLTPLEAGRVAPLRGPKREGGQLPCHAPIALGERVSGCDVSGTTTDFSFLCSAPGSCKLAEPCVAAPPDSLSSPFSFNADPGGSRGVCFVPRCVSCA